MGVTADACVWARRTHLAHALRIADVRQELLETLAAVSDFSYGWGLLDGHIDRLQAEVTLWHIFPSFAAFWTGA